MLGFVSKIRNFVWEKIVRWLTYERDNSQTPLSDFDRLRYELRPGDALLVEGRSKVSEIIKIVTQSIWTHSAIYIGRMHDIDDPELRKHILKFYQASADDQLVIESLLGEGTIIDKLDKYKDEHIRICRPKGLTRIDSQKVVGYAINQLGTDYNVRQLLDLARFIFPYSILPRRWRSSLFEANAGRPTKTVCSTMMAEAFASVQFPIRAVLHQDSTGKIKLYRSNSSLITPPDFDYSPYFDVIKYPLMDFDELAVYRTLPWDRSGVHCNAVKDSFVRDAAELEQANTQEEDKSPEDSANTQDAVKETNNQAH